MALNRRLVEANQNMNGEVMRISGTVADLTSYMAQAERSVVVKIIALCALLWIGVFAATTVAALTAHRGDDQDIYGIAKLEVILDNLPISACQAPGGQL
jgi:hypothetical protein